MKASVLSFRAAVLMVLAGMIRVIVMGITAARSQLSGAFAIIGNPVQICDGTGAGVGQKSRGIS
jgi:hypothetical protein